MEILRTVLYLTESQFFVRSSLNVAILVDSQDSAGCPSVANLTFHGYFVNHVEEVVDELVTNNLYRVRINHPVIDAVGILSNEVTVQRDNVDRYERL